MKGITWILDDLFDKEKLQSFGWEKEKEKEREAGRWFSLSLTVYVGQPDGPLTSAVSYLKRLIVFFPWIQKGKKERAKAQNLSNAIERRIMRGETLSHFVPMEAMPPCSREEYTKDQYVHKWDGSWRVLLDSILKGHIAKLQAANKLRNFEASLFSQYGLDSSIRMTRKELMI